MASAHSKNKATKSHQASSTIVEQAISIPKQQFKTFSRLKELFSRYTLTLAFSS